MTQSVELLLDDELDSAVREQWAALAAAGVPSQAQHTGETNRPHITLTVASAVLPYLETAIKAALTGKVPLPVRLDGLLCFAGPGGHQILARAVVPSVALLELQADCAALFDGLPGGSPLLQPGSWMPHVTLAMKVPARQINSAIAALGENTGLVGNVVAVRRWNSDARTAWLVG